MYHEKSGNPGWNRIQHWKKIYKHTQETLGFKAHSKGIIVNINFHQIYKLGLVVLGFGLVR
jgi:hypothetical protein